MRATILSAVLVASSLFTAPAFAADATIVVVHPWLRATPRAAPVAGGYVTLTNTGTEPDTLVSARLTIAPEGQVHTMTMKNGVMEMRRLDKGLAIAPGATVTLRPGGDHLMFLDPRAQLKEGESVEGSLTFERAGTLPVTFVVGGMAAKTAPAARGGPGHRDMPGMDMPGMDMEGTHTEGTR